jgi:carbon monoxide dehydrogenase subunit G
MLLVLAAITAATTGLSDPELQKALAGEVAVHAEAFTTPEGKDAGRGVGAIVIGKPSSAVWTTLTHYEDRAEYIPRVEKVRVIDKTDARVHVWQQIDVSVTTARFTAYFDLDPKQHVIHWALDRNVSDNTLKDVDGEYRLFDVDGDHTLLVYRSYVDSGLKVPKSIQMYIAKKSIPDLLKAIKQRVESGGTWKKK